MTKENKSKYATRPKITDEDLRLLATPSEELRGEAEISSFDIEKFDNRVHVGEKWQQLIQAHLYYDHVISELLSDALVKPDAIKAERMGFLQKLHLVEALGLISQEVLIPIQFINKLRNNIAHSLDFEITEKDVIDLKNCTPKYLRELMLTAENREEGPLEFYELLEVTLHQIEVLRQQHAFNRLQNKKSSIRLRTVLEKTEGAVYRE